MCFCVVLLTNTQMGCPEPYPGLVGILLKLEHAKAGWSYTVHEMNTFIYPTLSALLKWKYTPISVPSSHSPRPVPPLTVLLLLRQDRHLLPPRQVQQEEHGFLADDVGEVDVVDLSKCRSHVTQAVLRVTKCLSTQEANILFTQLKKIPSVRWKHVLWRKNIL